MKMADGRKYKMLVAPLILDLDGRINLNVVGNILARPANTHASNQGWGMWEVNPGLVLDADISNPPAHRVSTEPVPRRSVDGGPLRQGWHKPAAIPMSSNGYTSIRVQEYAQVDMNSTLDPNTEQPGDDRPVHVAASGSTTTPPWTSFPYFPTGYGNANPGGGLPQEVTPNHPLFYNVLNLVGPNRLLPLSSLVSMLRYGGSGGGVRRRRTSYGVPEQPFPAAEQLEPGRTTAQRRRNQITLLSMDLDRPGLSPVSARPD